MNGKTPVAAVFGCSGPELTPDERDFFRDADPYGFILFARNCETPDQVRALTNAMRECAGRDDAAVLIDQEGGRVARLTPPHWRAAPPPATFAKLAVTNLERAVEAAKLNFRLIGAELIDHGITIDCAPVLDVPHPGSDPIIGDRASGPTPELAAQLGAAACEGLLDGGVLPVIKHIPGHGRASVDSHKALPVVDADLAELESVDFRPFCDLNNAPLSAPWAMTAHVVYSAIDADNPATTSAKVIGEIIRGYMGFGGVLVSDDLEMEALQGSIGVRAAAAVDAGCDLALHCNGTVAEMAEVAAACGNLKAESIRRIAAAEAMRRKPQPLDREEAEARLKALMEGRP